MIYQHENTHQSLDFYSISIPNFLLEIHHTLTQRMISKTKRREKSRKSGSLLPEQDPFASDEITQVIGITESRQNSRDEGDTGYRDQMATSTARLEETDLLNRLLEQKYFFENPRRTFSVIIPIGGPVQSRF